jgi:hypothetical protein
MGQFECYKLLRYRGKGIDCVTETIAESPHFTRKYTEKKASDEAISTIYKALHPPLCMGHALELVDGKPRYEFKPMDADGTLHRYIFHLPFGMEIAGVTLGADGCFKVVGGGHLHRYDWFYPVNHLGNPTHGEAEAVVNAWKEGE